MLLNKRRMMLATAAVIWLGGLLAACSKEAEKGGEPASGVKGKTEDTAVTETLTIYNQFPLDEGSFEQLFLKPIKDKYPNVTLNVINRGKGTEITDLLASNTVPDILFTGFYYLPQLKELGIPLDLNAMVQDKQVDVKQFPAALNDTFKLYSDKQELYALPYYLNIAALFYNKDIFDRFGVAYPKDGMSWNEAIELGKKITQTVDGVPYIGFYPGNWSFLAGQFPLNRVDAGSHKAVFNTPLYKQVFDTLKEGFAATGQPYADYGAARGLFLKNKTIAMFPLWLNDMIGEFEKLEKEGAPLNWDMVVQPTFQGMNSQVDAHFLTISNTSKHKSLAFDIIAYLATDANVQLNVSKLGRIPALNDKKLVESYGAGLKSAQGKRTEIIGKNNMQKQFVPTKYDNLAAAQLNKASDRVLKEKIDVNTALREAEEAANKAIEAEMRK